MKVSILTLIGANNVGAFLQAFALKQTISDMGYEVEFLTMPENSENRGKIEKVKRYLSQKNYRLLIYKIRTGKKYREVRTMLQTVQYSNDVQYEIVVVGSDEVWNISSDSFIHYPQFFGKDINADKIISYAPSCGNTSYDQFISSNMDFKSFDSISVRDDNTRKLVKKVTEQTPILVMDPTFLLESYDRFIPEIKMDENYILVYSYGMNEDYIRSAKEFAHKNKLPLYSVGTYNSWCSKNLIVTPFEFLAYLKKAKYVITSTFHGTALSINLKKEFVVCSTGSDKINSLLKEFCLQSRIVQKESILNIMKSNIDYQVVDKILSDKRDCSLKFLSDSLDITRRGV